MSSMVLEVSVQPIAPLRPDDEHQPRELVVSNGQDLRDDPPLQPRSTTLPSEFFEDEKVPLFVVLLEARHECPVINPSSETRAPRGVRHRHIGNALPAVSYTHLQ